MVSKNNRNWEGFDGDLATNLPITFLCDRNISMLALIMLWVNPTKHNFASFLLLSIAIEPKGKDRFLNKTLFNHVIPEKKITRLVQSFYDQRGTLNNYQ